MVVWGGGVQNRGCRTDRLYETMQPDQDERLKTIRADDTASSKGSLFLWFKEQQGNS